LIWDNFLLDVHLLLLLINPFIAGLALPSLVILIVDPSIPLIARFSLGSVTVQVATFVVHHHGWVPYSLTLPRDVKTVRLTIRLGTAGRGVQRLSLAIILGDSDRVRVVVVGRESILLVSFAVVVVAATVWVFIEV